MKTLGVVLVALAFSAAARADTPSGFKEAPRLEPSASWVAGKHVRVWCAKSVAAFNAASAEQTGRIDTAGFAVVGASDLFLKPLACASMHAWLNKRRVEDYTFAASALTLAHEATHLRGMSNEGETDCAALAKLPAVIRRWFPVKGHGIDLAALMLYARDSHDRAGPDYAGRCG